MSAPTRLIQAGWLLIGAALVYEASPMQGVAWLGLGLIIWGAIRALLEDSER